MRIVCSKVFLKGAELAFMKKLIECAEIALKFQHVAEGDAKVKFGGLMEILTSNATAKQKECLEKTQVLEKMATAYDAIRDTVGVDLYKLNGKVTTEGVIQDIVVGSIFGLAGLLFSQIADAFELDDFDGKKGHSGTSMAKK